MAFDIDPMYKEVPERIADLKVSHPNARLRPVDETRPYWIETLGDKVFVVYAAACYLDPDDPLPGIGVAWEPFPGKTPYTKDSELMNAETSAWGRAIVAALQSESKTVASANEVRNRTADQDDDTTIRRAPPQRAAEASKRPAATSQQLAERAATHAPTGDPNLISDKQVKLVAILMGKKGIPDERSTRHAWIAGVVDREFKSSKDLTKKEASAVIDALNLIPDGGYEIIEDGGPFAQELDEAF